MARLLEQLLVPIADLRPYPGNPRRGNLEAITESLVENGQFRPIMVNRRGMVVLAGNHTFMAAKALGWKHILATVLDLDDEQARRIVLVDNRTSDVAGYDASELLELLEGGEGLAGTGYGQDDLDELLDEVQGPLPLDEQELPARPIEPRTAPGDLYELGDHRLLCGDATTPEAWVRLMGGDEANLMFTDPPYGVSYRDRGPGAWNAKKLALKQAGLLRPRFEAIEGDDRAGDELLSFLVATFAEARKHSRPKAAWYVWHASRTQTIFEAALGAVDYEIRAQVIWAKSRPAFNFAQYKYRHEPCFYAFRSGQVPAWYGDRSQTTLWEVPSESGAGYEHPTQKPVGLAEIAIRNSTRRSGVVADPFAGSGPTLIGCERLGRRARCMELDPRYCDVIVERFERLTGERARLV